MKLSGTSGIVTIVGALVIVFAILHHFLFAKSFLTFNHASIIIGVIGAVVLVIGLVMGMSGGSSK